MTNQGTGRRRLLTGVACFGLLVAVGLGLHLVARPARGLDHRLVADAVAARTPTLTSIAHAASVLGRSWVLIVIAVLVGAGLVRRVRSEALGPLLAVLGADLLQHVLKDLVQRPRPAVAHLERVSGSSFPSGHATESAAVAAAVLLLLREWPQRPRLTAWALMLALVGAIGASRVYLGVHYPTDVIAGIVLGGGWGAAADWIVRDWLPPRRQRATATRLDSRS